MALNKTTSNTIIGLESTQTICNSTFSEKSFFNLHKPSFAHYLAEKTVRKAIRWLLLLMKITAFLVFKRNFDIKRCSAPLTLTFLFFSSPPWFPRGSWICYMRQCDITARTLLLALIRILPFAPAFYSICFFVPVCLLFYLLFNQVSQADYQY